MNEPDPAINKKRKNEFKTPQNGNLRPNMSKIDCPLFVSTIAHFSCCYPNVLRYYKKCKSTGSSYRCIADFGLSSKKRSQA